MHWLREFGHRGVKVAAVNGSLITERVLQLTDRILENGQPTSTLQSNLVSAEVYLGAEPIVDALKQGAHIVVSGRVAGEASAVQLAVAALAGVIVVKALIGVAYSLLAAPPKL